LIGDPQAGEEEEEQKDRQESNNQHGVFLD
jgi:hypothetical protein